MKYQIQMTLLFILLLAGSCDDSNRGNLKTINTGKFRIQVPVEWKYHEEQGIDSFVGNIKGRNVDLSFDWSEMGYANHLIPTENEFIHERDWEWMPIDLPYGKNGVTYTSGSIEGERKRIMKEKGITDSSLVKVEPFQIPNKKIELINNEYIATLTYKDTVVRVKIEIPELVRNHVIQVDTISHYRRKLIRPKKGMTGMTGAYLEDLKSSFNFNLAGFIEDSDHQEAVFRSLKTIELNRK